jgi:flagellar protein FlaG
MSIGSAALASSVGVTPPTQPTTAVRQVQDNVDGQVQNGIKTTADTKGADAAAVVQDSRQTEGADGKKLHKDKEQPPKEKVEEAVSSVNDYIEKLRHRELQFSLDDKSGRMVVQLRDTGTKEVIRQIPPEYMLRLADSIGKEKGWLLEEHA